LTDAPWVIGEASGLKTSISGGGAGGYGGGVLTMTASVIIASSPSRPLTISVYLVVCFGETVTQSFSGVLNFATSGSITADAAFVTA
jgi:hypothetical protein